MNRCITHAAAVFLVTVLASAGNAWAKPSIAVLGLEVKANGTSLDEKTTKVATDLTKWLRQRARLPNSPFKLAPNSEKDLLEARVLECGDAEGPSCIAKIGRGMHADRVLYGRIAKRPGKGYQVSLDLLNVKTKGTERSTSEIIPFNESSSGQLKDWAKTLYARVAGMPTAGDLIIKANAPSGTVYVDGKPKGSLQDGTAKIKGLSEGPHTIGIESSGYETYAGEVTIAPGRAENLDVTLKQTEVGPGPGPGPGGGGGGGGGTSRVLFWTSLVAAAAAGTAMTVTGLQVRGSLKTAQLEAIQDLKDRMNNPIQLRKDNACGHAAEFPNDPGAQAVVDACDAGKSRAMLSNVFLGVTVASAVAAGFFYWKGFMQTDTSSSRERSSKARRNKHKRNAFRVLPAVGPNQVGVGATLEW